MIWDIVYRIVGVVFVVAISLGISAISINWVVVTLQSRRDSVFESYMRRTCSELDRWCSHEFPQVGFVAREIIVGITHGWSFDVALTRDKLRAKAYEEN